MMNETGIKTLSSDSEYFYELENLVRLASEICGAKSAMTNLLNESHQVTCVNVGWENKKVPLEDSICQFTIGEEGVVQFEDTNRDTRLQEIKAVYENSDIGFYAGVSFNGIDGYSDGTLCVIDNKPRKLNKNQRFALQTLASEVESKLELIQSRKQIIRQSKKMEKTVRFLNNSADIMLLLDPRTLAIQEVHSDVSKKLGYRVDELEGKRFNEFCQSPELADRLKTWSTNLGPDRFSFEVYFLRKSDEPLPMLMNVTKWDGSIYLTGRDISRRKVAEHKLRKEKTLSEGIVDNLPGIFCLIDEEGHILRWNRNLETLTGLSGNEIRQSSFETFLTRDSLHQGTKKLAQIFKHKSASTEVTIVAHNGNRRPFQINGFRYQVEEKVYAVVIGLDASEKKEMLYQLEEKEERLMNALKRL